MILSIHQPAYLPWLGYIDRIACSDVFVYLDNVQFEKNSFINRNKIKTANGPIWLTVPVLKQGHIANTMTELKINNQKNWQVKHQKAIECNYHKSKNFELCWPKIRGFYSSEKNSLIDFCYEYLEFWLSELNIKTKIIRASEMEISGTKDQLVLNICKELNASRYLSGPNGRSYLNLEDFNRENIELVFHEFLHPSYEQLYGEFLPNMGVIDYWMNDGHQTILHR